MRISFGGIEFWRRLFCEVDFLIKFLRIEGFGISGFRVIFVDLFVFVSGNCGFGMVLKKLFFGK